MKKFEILMPATKQEKTYGGSSGSSIMDRVPLSLEDINKLVEGFGKYKLDSIELSIEATIEANGVTKLLVSTSGTAGVKLILKPNIEE